MVTLEMELKVWSDTLWVWLTRQKIIIIFFKQTPFYSENFACHCALFDGLDSQLLEGCVKPQVAQEIEQSLLVDSVDNLSVLYESSGRNCRLDWVYCPSTTLLLLSIKHFLYQEFPLTVVVMFTIMV